MPIERVNLYSEPDPIRGYSIPFIGDIKISQGRNGRYSHFAYRVGPKLVDDRFAVDFELPIGTEILSTKSGIVQWVEDHHDGSFESTCINDYYNLENKPSPNFVIIDHDPGVRTIYSHFRKNGVTVHSGNYVEEGQLIGYTGKSGWIGPIPHLHVETVKINIGTDRLSVPMIFDRKPLHE